MKQHLSGAAGSRSRMRVAPPRRHAPLLLLLIMLTLMSLGPQHSHAAANTTSSSATRSTSTSSPAQQPAAYLVASQREPFVPANSSYNNLRLILQSIERYRSIVLTEDYVITNPKEFQANDPVRLPHDLLLTSAAGQRNMLSFAFLSSIVLMNNHTVTLRSIVVSAARKTSGQSVPFFSGEGVLSMVDMVRKRVVCSASVNATVNTLRTTPRPLAFPGTQQVQVLPSYVFRGRPYADSLHVQDVALFVSPGDVEDAAYYAGYSVVQSNVTRICDMYVPVGCNEQCQLQMVENILAAQLEGAAGGSSDQQLAAIVVPAVVVPVVVLASAAALAVWWVQRKHRAKSAAQQRKQQEQQQLRYRLEEGSGGGYHGVVDDEAGGGYGGTGRRRGLPGARGSRRLLDLAPHGPGVPAGLLGRSLDVGAVGSIEEVAIGGEPGGNGTRKGWHLMACHTAPEFPEATAKDAISLGVLLGAGSFGRVYRGRWRGLDVAVKVLHHDVNTAASVANEVDLVMSFRHPNITTAYHFLTWNHSHDTADGTASGSLEARGTPNASNAATAGTSAATAAAVAAVMAAGAAAASGSNGAAAGGSSGVGPVTPCLLPQPPASRERPSTDVCSSSSGQAPHAAAAAAAGGAMPVNPSLTVSSSTVPGAGQDGVGSSGTMAAELARASAGTPASALSWGSETQRQQQQPASGGSGSNSATAGDDATTPRQLAGMQQQQHMQPFGEQSMLQNLESPQASRKSQQTLPPATAAAAAEGAASVDATLNSSGGGAVTPTSSSLLRSSVPADPQQASAVEGAGSSSRMSVDAANGPGWVPTRLTPMWGSAAATAAPYPAQGSALSPGQVTSGFSMTASTGLATGHTSQSFVGSQFSVHSEQQHAQQQGQGQASPGAAAAAPSAAAAAPAAGVRKSASGRWQPLSQQQQHDQLQQQQFVPMVRYPAQPGATAGDAQGGGGQQQQHRFVPLIQLQQQHDQQQHQQHQRHHSDGASSSGGTASTTKQFSGQLRQQLHLPLSRLDGSGTSSYAAGGPRARSGEAQTWLLLELCAAGTLLDVMQEGGLRSDDGTVHLAHVLSLLSDVAAGMNYLHLRNCVHGDLKPANVLLMRQQGAPFGHIAKVSDFGLSKSLTAGQSHRSTRTLGTFNRAPPELLRLGRLSPACDVYAYGILMWELFTGLVAFSGAHYGEVFERVALLQERPPIPPEMPQDFADLMSACWSADPLARPTFRVIQEELAALLKRVPNSSERFVSDL